MQNINTKLPIIIIILCLSLAGLLQGLSYGIEIVMFPIIFNNHGLDKTTIALLNAITVSVVFILSPMMPKLIKRFGFFTLLCIGPLLRSTGLLTVDYMSHIYPWTIAMFLIGLGGFTTYMAISIWLNLIIENQYRARSMAIIFSAYSVGIAVAPFIIKLFTGYSGTSPLIYGSIFSAITLLPVFCISKYMSNTSTNIPPSKLTIKDLIKKTPIPLLSGTLSEWVFYTLVGFSILYGMSIGLSESYSSTFVTAQLIGAITFELPMSYLSDRTSRNKVILWSIAITGLLSVILMFYAHQTTWVTPIIIACIAGLLAGTYTSSLAIIGDRFKNSDMIQIYSRFYIIAAIGGVVGLITTGILMDRLGGIIGFPCSIAIVCVIYLTAHLYHDIRAKKHQ